MTKRALEKTGSRSRTRTHRRRAGGSSEAQAEAQAIRRLAPEIVAGCQKKHPHSWTQDNALNEIAVSKNTSRLDLVVMIDKKRSHPNLSSAIRLFVLDHYRRIAKRKRTEE